MKTEIIKFYLKTALNAAELSYCERKKVGAVLVDGSGKNILAYGFNGTVSGFPNVCEVNGMTDHKKVLHAETNAIMKVAKSTQSTEGSYLFLTLSPCSECAKLIIQAGIKKVYFSEIYRDSSPLDILYQAGIETELFVL